MNWMHMDSV
ncbi:unnamed protein product [Staurois parvus]|uniref:Uncharacterized protein n=1 Tax=Staurois parvus TaxID=386267 RepID=A0ABN9FVF1_9NEOB|nr:unnamed protein product [Staurois parvus]